MAMLLKMFWLKPLHNKSPRKLQPLVNQARLLAGNLLRKECRKVCHNHRKVQNHLHCKIYLQDFRLLAHRNYLRM
jgi:hypothetical protein